MMMITISSSIRVNPLLRLILIVLSPERRVPI